MSLHKLTIKNTPNSSFCHNVYLDDKEIIVTDLKLNINPDSVPQAIITIPLETLDVTLDNVVIDIIPNDYHVEETVIEEAQLCDGTVIKYDKSKGTW